MIITDTNKTLICQLNYHAGSTVTGPTTSENW